MAKLYVTEFKDIGGFGNFPIASAAMPPIADQTPVVIGAGSLQSAQFNPKTTFVRIHTDAICSIAFGANPTATANSARMAANTTEYFAIVPGQVVAVIQNT